MHIFINKTGAITLFISPILLGIVMLSYIQPMWYEEYMINRYFNNWDDDPYNVTSHNCGDMSVEVEEYWEIQCGYNCYLVYGSNCESNHIWVVVQTGSRYHEFESTCLSFQSMSDEYNVTCVQQGFYMDGVRYNRSQSFDNWDKVLGGFF